MREELEIEVPVNINTIAATSNKSSIFIPVSVSRMRIFEAVCNSQFKSKVLKNILK